VLTVAYDRFPGIVEESVERSCDREAHEGRSRSPANSAESSQIDRISAFEKGLRPDDVKSFGGAAALPIGGLVASIIVPQAEQEKQFLANFICVDESECFGPKKFEHYILKTYPDIVRVHFKLPPDLADEDKDDVEHTKQDFRRGLYFAKLITLANGQTLFDFLTKCSKTVAPFNWAEKARELGADDKSYLSLQYFPVLVQDSTGDELELNILFKRTGDKIEATSPAFSSSILRDADFMDKHGLS
jgi:hypothetical protein